MSDIDRAFQIIIRAFSRSKKFTLSEKHLKKILKKINNKLERKLRVAIKKKNALLREIKPITLYIRRARGFSTKSPLFESGQLANSLSIINTITGREKKYIQFTITASNIKRKTPKRAGAKYKPRGGKALTNLRLLKILLRNGFSFYKFLFREMKWIKKEIAKFMIRTYKRGVYTRTFS